MNQAYIEVLVKLTQLLESSKYIVLGSIATLS